MVFNRKDANTFCSASLDRTLKVWQLGSNQPNFTLEGHEKGVNCVDYYVGGDKPYLISGADDRMVKIWDYQNKTCVQTLEGTYPYFVMFVNFNDLCYRTCTECDRRVIPSRVANYSNRFGRRIIAHLACEHISTGKFVKLQYGACLVRPGTQRKVCINILTSRDLTLFQVTRSLSVMTKEQF